MYSCVKGPLKLFHAMFKMQVAFYKTENHTRRGSGITTYLPTYLIGKLKKLSKY